MRLGSGLIVSVLLAGGILLGLSATTGCNSEKRTSSVQATEPAEGRAGHADNMAGSDAERAKADLERQDKRSRTECPAAPPTRSGSRAVDQPRVSPRP